MLNSVCCKINMIHNVTHCVLSHGFSSYSHDEIIQMSRTLFSPRTFSILFREILLLSRFVCYLSGNLKNQLLDLVVVFSCRLASCYKIESASRLIYSQTEQISNKKISTSKWCNYGRSPWPVDVRCYVTQSWSHFVTLECFSPAGLWLSGRESLRVGRVSDHVVIFQVLLVNRNAGSGYGNEDLVAKWNEKNFHVPPLPLFFLLYPSLTLNSPSRKQASDFSDC